MPGLRHAAGAGRIAAGPARESLRLPAGRRRARARTQIKDALVAEYGEEVLALPQGSGFDLSAYLVPIVAFVDRRGRAGARGAALAPRRRAARTATAGRRRAARAPRTPSASTPTSPATTSEAASARRRRRRRRAARPAAAAAARAARARPGPSLRRRDAGEDGVGLRRRPPASAARRRRAAARRGRPGRRRRAASAIAWRKLSRRAGSPGRPPAAPATTQTSGSVARRAAGPARTSGWRISGALASQRRYSCRPGAGARPELGREPRPRQVALEQRPCGGRRRPAAAARPIATAPRPSSPPVTSTAALLAQPLAAASPSASRSARRSDQARASPGAGPEISARTGSLRAPAAHHIRSGAEIPSRPSAAAIVRFVAEAERQPRALDPLALGADHLAVAVEGVEVGGDRGRVGADPVRRAPRGGLADLVGELEQALDQRLLAGLERGAARPRRRARPPAASAASPALRRMLAMRACAYWT